MVRMATSKDNTPPVSFSPMEKNAINRLLEIAAAFKTSKSKKMKTASPLAQGKKCIAKGQKTTTGYYTTIVPCGLQELHAYIEAEDTSTYYIEKIDEAYNDHHSINYYAMSFPKPVRKREWHQSVVTKVEAEKVVIVSVPCFIEEEARNVHPDRVRAEIRNMYILSKITDSVTRADFYAEFELGGYMPRWIINHELQKFMSAPTKWQIHFQHQQKLNQLTAEDGKNMGIMLMNKKKGESAEERLDAFLSKNEALQQLKTTTFPQLEGMMLALLQNKLFHKKARDSNKVAVEPQNSQLARVFRSPVSAVRTLNDLTEAEATKIGRSFKLLLLTTTEPAAAVDAWKLDNQVLAPLFAENAWFEPMINSIAKQVSERSERALWTDPLQLTHSYSLKMRLASLRFAPLGAALAE